MRLGDLIATDYAVPADLMRSYIDLKLGLVYDVEIEKEDVYVTFTLTTPACPIGPQVSEKMKEFVGDLPGVSAVHPKMVFEPPWSPEIMTEDAKFALGF
jgi:metal-sulfur cluster biosynthetic enzyme